MYTYNTYVQEINTITFEEATEIYEKLITSLDFNKVDTKELWNDLMENVVSYVSIRSGWLLLTREERTEKDKGRTRQHNSLIISLDMICRYLKKLGRDIGWRSQLGEDRKRIGDFACYLVFIYGLNAR